MSSTPSAPMLFYPLSRTATSLTSARTSELSSNGAYTSVDAHKRFDNVRVFRSVGTGACELSATLNLSRAEARALALELLAATDAVEPPEVELAWEDLGYALNRHVPDMGRGFTIETTYGDVHISDGELATRVQTVLRSALEALHDVPAVAKAA